MKFEEILQYISKNAIYRGRSIAYYEDGMEYGVLTIIGIRDHYLVSVPKWIVFSEKDRQVLCTDAKSSVKESAICDADLSALPFAPYGKRYRYSFETEDGQTIYISPFE